MYGRALVRTSLRGISSVRPLRSRPTRLGFTSSRYRSSSSATAFSSTRTDDSTSQEYLPSTQSPKPFAIEHVGGREHHLSWSPKGGISKEWKEERAIDADVKNGTPQAVSSPMMSGAVGRMKSWFMQMFLPTNYPHSVHRSCVYLISFSSKCLIIINSYCTVMRLTTYSNLSRPLWVPWSQSSVTKRFLVRLVSAPRAVYLVR